MVFVLIGISAHPVWIGLIFAYFLGFKLDYREIVYRSKKLITQSSMAGEVNVLGHLLNRISESLQVFRKEF